MMEEDTAGRGQCLVTTASQAEAIPRNSHRTGQLARKSESSRRAYYSAVLADHLCFSNYSTVVLV